MAVSPFREVRVFLSPLPEDVARRRAERLLELLARALIRRVRAARAGALDPAASAPPLESENPDECA